MTAWWGSDPDDDGITAGINAPLGEALIASQTFISGWQPIETAPCGIDIDVWISTLEGGGWRKTGHIVSVDPFCMLDENWCPYFPHENGGWATHWMPLPSAPSA